MVLKEHREIAFFMSDKRHLDYFRTLFEYLKKEEIPFSLLINDLIERSEEDNERFRKEIESFSDENGYLCRSAVAVLQKREQFPLIVSLFAHLIRVPYGRVKIKAVFRKIVASLLNPVLKSKRFTHLFPSGFQERVRRYSNSDGDTLHQMEIAEKALATQTIFFPKGLDISPNYPDIKIRKIPDQFFCHGNLDQHIINESTGKLAIPIGYPRYDNMAALSMSRKKIYQEFGMNPDQKLVVWLPTYFPDRSNIDQWKEEFVKISKRMNVLVRPHPKQVQRAQNDLISELKEHGLYVDSREERVMTELYAASDLVCCDYGGTIFSTIYTRARLLLLDTLEHEEIKARRSHSSDMKIREKLFHLSPRQMAEFGRLESLLNDQDLAKRQKEEQECIRSEYFGSVEIGEGTRLCAEALFRLAGFDKIQTPFASGG